MRTVIGDERVANREVIEQLEEGPRRVEKLAAPLDGVVHIERDMPEFTQLIARA